MPLSEEAALKALREQQLTKARCPDDDRYAAADLQVLGCAHSIVMMSGRAFARDTLNNVGIPWEEDSNGSA